MRANLRVFVLLLLTTWITWFAIANPVGAAGRRPPPPPRAPPPPPSPQTIASFDITEPTEYPTFIKQIRDKVADSTEKCTIQTLKKPPAQQYVNIELIVSTTEKITLAIDTSNLYVLGYGEIVVDKQNKIISERAFFFQDVKEAVINIFFPNLPKESKKNLPFTGSYDSLKKIKGGDREGSILGIFQLQNNIASIFGKPQNINDQAKFSVVVIQMVAEATRFKSISDQIPTDTSKGEQYYKGVKVDSRIMELENGWDKLSTAVYKSKASTKTPTKCELSTPSVTLGTYWTFTTVEAIKAVVGLLKSS